MREARIRSRTKWHLSLLLAVNVAGASLWSSSAADAAAKKTTKAAKTTKKATASAAAQHKSKGASASVSLGSLRQIQLAQSKVRANQVKAASSIKAAKATSAQAAEALDVLNSQVRVTSVALDRARRSATRAGAEAKAARAKERELTKQLDGLRSQQREAALHAFTTMFGNADSVLSAGSASEAVRLSQLDSLARRQSADTIDRLNALQEDLLLQRAIADKADRQAKAYREAVSDRLSAYETARKQQEALASDAEERLESQLAEAQILASLDAKLSKEISAQNDALARQLRSAGIGRSGSGSYSGGTLPSAGSVSTSSGGSLHGIVVASSIRPQIAALLAAAKADGIYLTGGGYRSSASQISLRRAHCGSSYYAIYQMRSSQCHPPTARPGASQHERGLAIDFVQNGRALTRSSSGYRWLKANAWRYGMKNLPSEPWHWSTTGR